MEELLEAIKTASKNGKLKMVGIDWTMVLTSAIGELMVRLKSEKERKKVYDAGKASGLNAIDEGFGSWIPKVLKDLGMKIAVRHSKKDFMLGNADISKWCGWGEFEIVKFEDDEAILRVKESPIARYILDKYGKQKHNVCSWIMGEQAGVYSYFAGKDMDAKETKCLAKDDPYCEFVIKPVRK